MSKYNANAFGSVSLHSRLASFFCSQTELLEELLEKPFAESCRHVTPLLGAIHGNCKAILLLERDGLLNELALIQRLFVQRITNYCYLLNAEQEVIRKYLSSPTTSAKHSLKDEGVDALVDFSKSYDPEAAVSPFPLTLREQAEEIFQKTGVPKELFLVTIAGVFPKSAEILAGSLFGTAFQFGDFRRNTSETAVEDSSFVRRSEELTTALFWGVCLLGALFKCISKREPIESIEKKSARNVEVAENLIQGARKSSLQIFSPVDGTWERLDSMESGASSVIAKQLREFRLPFQEAYEAGVIAPMLKPASPPSVDLNCAALLLKRSLNDFRVVWVLLNRGYTSQAASVAASLYESALATICLTLSKQNVEAYKAHPNREIPWKPMQMAKMVVKGTKTDSEIQSKEFENHWRALYAHYVWLCQIKHSAHDSVLYDTSATSLDGKGYVVMAIPSTELADADLKAAIAIKSLLRITEATEAFAKALGFKDKLPDESRFAERIDFAREAGWNAFQPFAKPSPISISRSWFVKKYPPIK